MNPGLLTILLWGFLLLSLPRSSAQNEGTGALGMLYEQERFQRILSITGKDPEAVPPAQAFWMGKALKRIGDHRAALASFRKASRGELAERAEAELEACRKAIEWKKDPVCEVEPLEAVNTDAHESCPAWGDGTYTTLLFTQTQGRGEGRNEDLMVTDKRDHGRWKDAVPFGKDLNDAAHELSLTIDPEEGKGFFSRCSGKRCRIHRIERKDGVWEDVGVFDLLQPCAPDSVNLTHPAYHPRSGRLYFSSDMPGGEGGYDLWYIERDSVTGDWTDPVNAGTAVNTPGDEIFPSVRKDGRLYFSSDGHAGMGGMDIFRAERDGVGGHEKVRNMGYPINSGADDTRIIFEGKRMRGFFSSDRKRKGETEKDDLFRFFEKT